MEVVENADRFVVRLTRDEALIVNNALNELCNGAGDLSDDSEFATRVGATRQEALVLLREMGDMLGRPRRRGS